MTFYLGTIGYKDAFAWTGDIHFRFIDGKLMGDIPRPRLLPSSAFRLT